MTRRRQRGLGMVELMVGLVVGMLLIAGLAVMFGNASRSSAELDKSMRHIENGRHAIELLAEDLALAGYYGTAAVSTFTDSVSPCADAAAVANQLNAVHAAARPPTLPRPVQGYTDAEAATLACLPHRKPGTPALALRRLDTAALAVGAAPTGTLVLQAAHHMDDTQPFIAATGSAGLTLRDRLGNPNVVRSFLVRVYYVARCSDCTGAGTGTGGGDGIPTLMRAEFRNGSLVATPLAEGIDQVAFDYGFDTTGDGVPDRWIGLGGQAGTLEAADAAAAGWGNVMAVRVSVLSRNLEPTTGHLDTRSYPLGLQGSASVSTGPFNDAFKRRVATTTARLHSVAGLRETQ